MNAQTKRIIGWAIVAACGIFTVCIWVLDAQRMLGGLGPALGGIVGYKIAEVIYNKLLKAKDPPEPASPPDFKGIHQVDSESHGGKG